MYSCVCVQYFLGKCLCKFIDLKRSFFSLKELNSPKKNCMPTFSYPRIVPVLQICTVKQKEVLLQFSMSLNKRNTGNYFRKAVQHPLVWTHLHQQITRLYEYQINLMLTLQTAQCLILTLLLNSSLGLGSLVHFVSFSSPVKQQTKIILFKTHCTVPMPRSSCTKGELVS